MKFLILFFVTIFSVSTYSAVIPTYTEPCKKSEPKFNDCLKKSLMKFIRTVGNKGVKDLGVPQLEPLIVPEQTVNYKNAGINSELTMWLKDIIVHGPTKGDIKSLKTNFNDPKAITVDVVFTFPKLFVEGNYKMDGKFNQLVINGKGPYNISLTEVESKVHMDGELVKQDGEEFMKAKKIDVVPQFKDIKMFFGNIVNGNPQLSDVINQLINQNWKIGYEQALPIAQQYIDRIATTFFNKIFLAIPYKQLIQ